MKELKFGTYIKGEDTFNFNFYTDLSAANKLKFTNSVVDVLIDDKYYNSVIRNLIFDFYIIDIMTDVDIDELKNSATLIEDIEQFLDETNIVDIVKENAVPSLFDELNKAVDNSVAYLTGIHPNPINEALSSLISTIEKKINEVDLNSMMDMAKTFAGITGELTPESIVNAYIASDTHNKNLADIEESKNRRAEFAKDMDIAIKTVSKESKSKKK